MLQIDEHSPESEHIFKGHLLYDVLYRFVSTNKMFDLGQPRTVFDTIALNSSKLSFPSPSLSASMIVLSTICCNCASFKLFPTIILSTRNNSPFEM